MAISDYICCSKCETKLIYDGNQGNRRWWKEQFGSEVNIKCPKCVWVGLTDEESIAMLQKAAKHKSPDYCTAPEMAVEFGRLTSEALKEKNP